MGARRVPAAWRFAAIAALTLAPACAAQGAASGPIQQGTSAAQPPATQQTVPQQAPPQSKAATPDASGKKSAAQPSQQQNSAKRSGKNASPVKPDPDAELDRAIESAGNDRAALVRNLENYLKRFPDAPRKGSVYRALLEAELQLREPAKAIDYAERIIAIEPDDSSTMLLAATLLEDQGGDDGLKRAAGYVTRVLDRVEKATPEDKPARDSEVDWEAQQKHVEMTLYLLRGRLEMERQDNAEASADFETSYKLSPNPSAALQLGEIAELKGDREHAIDEYLIAFVLPSEEGASVDRADVRRKLGNLWELAHGSETGLGKRILATFDQLNAESKSATASEANKDVSDPFEFVLRKADGSESLKMSAVRGKVIVLDFWATWCAPCREMAPMLGQVAAMFDESKGDIVFLAVNDDEDESRVPPYLSKQKMHGTVVFADGLDTLLSIDSLPTIIVLDRTGKIAYRSDGFDPDSFVESLQQAILTALNTAAANIAPRTSHNP